MRQFELVDITIRIKNNTSCSQTANVLGSKYNLLDNSNALTEYSWDLSGFPFATGPSNSVITNNDYYVFGDLDIADNPVSKGGGSPTSTITLQYKAKDEVSFQNFTQEVENLTIDNIVAALNLLQIGSFYKCTTVGPVTTTTTTTTTTAAPITTTTTTSTTTAGPTTTTTTSTTTDVPTTTTTSTTSTTTEAPTTTTTTSTTTDVPTTTTTSTTSTTTAAPTCLCYTITNNTGGVQLFTYTPCGGVPVNVPIGNGGTFQRCSEVVPTSGAALSIQPCLDVTNCTNDSDCTGCYGNTTTTTTTSTTTEAPTTTTTTSTTTEAPTTTTTTSTTTEAPTTTTTTSTTTEAPTTTTTTSTTTLPGCVESVSFDVTTAGDVSVTNCCGIATIDTYSVGSHFLTADCYQVNSVVAIDAVITNVNYALPACDCATTTTTSTTSTTTVTGQSVTVRFANDPGSSCAGFTFNLWVTPGSSPISQGVVLYGDPGLTSPLNSTTYTYCVQEILGSTSGQTQFQFDNTTGTVGISVGSCP